MINDSNKLQIVTKIESWWTDFYNVHDVKFSLFESFHFIFPQWFKRETKLKEIRSVWINGVRIYQIIDTEAVLVKLWTAVIIKTKTNKSTCYTCMYSGCSLLILNSNTKSISYWRRWPFKRASLNVVHIMISYVLFSFRCDFFEIFNKIPKHTWHKFDY